MSATSAIIPLYTMASSRAVNSRCYVAFGENPCMDNTNHLLRNSYLSPQATEKGPLVIVRRNVSPGDKVGSVTLVCLTTARKPEKKLEGYDRDRCFGQSDALNFGAL